MVQITVELLRRRSEHNEGELSTLEEISLHQFDIEKIENLDKYCRNLKILYLQNNVIPRMENLNRLKSLEYLNLALNNVQRIEGIERCESLKKLDLTLNFIPLSELEVSCLNLAKVPFIEQLYLTGNPCTDWELCRKVVIAMVPQLKQLDGKDITHTERLDALQELPGLLAHLKVAVERGLYSRPTTYTIEARNEMAKENQRIQEEKENDKRKQEEKELGIVKKPPPPVFNSKGEVRQCNQGGYEYSFYEKVEKGKQFIVLEIDVPRYLDTSQIDVDLNPTYARVEIKGKILQLTFPCEISVSDSVAKRSQTNGSLQLVMPKLKNSLVPYFYYKEEIEEQKKPKEKVETKEVVERRINEIERKVEALKANKGGNSLQEDWEDDDEVPPLE